MWQASVDGRRARFDVDQSIRRKGMKWYGGTRGDGAPDLTIVDSDAY